MTHALYNELQLVESGQDEHVQLWMQCSATIAMMEEVLGLMNMDARHAKKLLSIIYMKVQDQDVFSESEHDVIMKREVNRFYPIFLNYLQNANYRGASTATVSPKEDTTRVLRFFDAWRRADVKILESFQNE